MLRTTLQAKGLTPKFINNVLGVLSTALRYADEAEIIDKVPAAAG